MRIAICGQTYYPGNNGQAMFTIHLAEGLAQAGHEVHVITPSWKFGYEYQVIQGVHVHKVRSINFRWVHPEACFTFFPSRQIRRVFQQHQPDIVHLQDHYFLSRDIIRVAEQMSIPVVGTNHFLPENLLPYLHMVPISDRAKISVLWRLMLWTYNRLMLVTTPTETAAKILKQQKIKPPVSAVSCGVNTNQFCPVPGFDRVAFCDKFGLDPKKVLFLYVGRLDSEKRIDLLLRGLAQLKKQGRTDIHLVIAGQGAAGSELRVLAKELRIEKQVRFLGYVENEHLPLLYQAGNIFCMPSPEELQSIATLEAMASGLPVLAANARALPELVTQGDNGYLFEPGKVAAIAEGMAYLSDNCQAWDEMGRASRARALAHSIEKTIQGYEAIYNQALEISRNGARVS